MAAIHNFQASIGCIHFIDRCKNSQMLDVFNMSVGIGIDMRVKTTYQAGERLSQGYKIGYYLPLPANL